MDVLSFLRVLVRRWYLVLPIALASLAGAAWFWDAAPSTYEATGTLLLKNPTGITDEIARENPYLGYGGLYVPGKVATDVVGARDYRERLAEVGVEPTYELLVDTTTQAPIIFVRVEGPTEPDAVGSVAAVLTAVQSALEQRQAETGAPEESFVTTEILTAPPDATPLYSSKLRGVGAILAVGALLTLGLVFAVEGVVRRRRAARDPEVVEEAQPEVPCSLCGDWLPSDRLIRHLQIQHALAERSSTTPAGEAGRDVAATHRAGRASRRHQRRSAVPVGVAATAPDSPSTSARKPETPSGSPRTAAGPADAESRGTDPVSAGPQVGEDAEDSVEAPSGSAVPRTPRQGRAARQQPGARAAGDDTEADGSPGGSNGARHPDPGTPDADPGPDLGSDTEPRGRRAVAAKFGP